MRNRAMGLGHGFSTESRAWDADQHPRGRLWLLFIVVFGLLSVVTVRLGQLQVGLSESFQTQFEQISETTEPIPSRDARIVSADGQVLAHDIDHYQIAVHYRWLEEPPDPRWLRFKANARLTRPQRRDAARVEAEQQQILALRKEMWQRLAELTETDEEELAEQRARVQQQVERIVASAEQRRDAKLQQKIANETPQQSPESSNASWWSRGWKTLVRTLTTVPNRGRLDPIIVREQQEYHTILKEIGLRRGMKIEAQPERFPGLRLEVATRRRYPLGNLAAHVVGYRTAISDEILAERRSRFGHADPMDYRHGDRFGKAGIERRYEFQLHGLRGTRRLYKSHRGEVVRDEIERQPVVRPDVIVTLDTRLQRHAEQLLDSALARRPKPDTEDLPIPQGGAIVAMHVHSGAILAAASAPRFDLDLLAQGSRAVMETARQDQRSPFLPRVTQMTLPPGSVFKTLTAAAVMESGSVSASREFFCQGYLDDPEHHRCYIFRHYGVGHGALNLQTALTQSCNVYFYSAARRAGPRPLVEWASRFGFGRPTGIDLPGERGGNLPQLKTGSGRNRRWQVADTLGLAIGQASLTVTPLQIVRGMAVIANGGYLVTPHVVSRFDAVHTMGERPDRNNELEHPEPRRIPGLSPNTLEQIHRGLVGVVEDPHGTAHKTVRLPGVQIAGKTGTAEVGGGKADHAWFAGYAPANRPQVAFVVVLEHAGSGGRAAGPLAQELVRGLVRLGLVEGKLDIASKEKD